MEASPETIGPPFANSHEPESSLVRRIETTMPNVVMRLTRCQLGVFFGNFIRNQTVDFSEIHKETKFFVGLPHFKHGTCVLAERQYSGYSSFVHLR